MNGSDLMGVSTDLVIDAGVIITTGCIDITAIIHDNFMLVEDLDESFTVAITTTNSNVALGNDVTTLTNGMSPGLHAYNYILRDSTNTRKNLF